MGKSDMRFTLQTGYHPATRVALVECKGQGHPDTLADNLAEELSRAYAQWTFKEFGAVLHHNFDKLALLGGLSEVRYGSGRMIAPVRVLVNGRAARCCGPVMVPVEDLITETVRQFFAQRLPELTGHLSFELNVTTHSSPGAVYVNDASPERASWFAPESTEGLRELRALIANDTSFGTGWAPEDPAESFARNLADLLSSPSHFTRARPWCGSDVKVMAMTDGDRLDVILCVPQKSQHVPNRDAYLAHCDEILEECQRLATTGLPDRKASFRLNARDIIERDELYLTYTGSSIESGDEGLVGRGNRVNGMITPLRPMNLEGVSGKNPVYHVGKLYNVAANRIAGLLHQRFGGYAEVHLISATGQALDQPWQIVVRMASTDANRHEVQDLANSVLSDFPGLTTEIIYGDLRLA